MAEKGARHLVLVSRSGPRSAEEAAEVEKLRSAGCEVLATSADVTDAGALRRVLEEVSHRMPPLRGVVHSAMVLDDTMIPAMTVERFWNCARSKILGAWNLHHLTLDAPLDFFVLYSSIAATTGNPGQANYAAGNTFLESLAHYRRSLGLCSTAIAWGAISDTGYLARNPGVRETLESRLSMRPSPARQALRYLEQVLADGGPHWIVADVNWTELASSFSALARSPRFSSLLDAGMEAEPAEAVEDIRARLRTLPLDEAREAVTEILTKELARVLGSTPGRIDPHRSMADLGVDSLMAVELLTAIDTRFHAPVTSLEIMGEATVSQLAGRIAAAIQAVPVDGQEPRK
jgi:phthiocerol/phenolphthiocerol synthesis type-I polyketide synthase C